MGRKFQNHERYEEKFVTLVEFSFGERHFLVLQYWWEADTLFELQGIASSDLAAPLIFFSYYNRSSECSNCQGAYQKLRA
jgi:hypothetical protein